MDRIILTCLFFLLSLLGVVLGQGDVACSTEAAETCLTERATQYNGVRSEYAENSGDTTKLRNLCLTQVRPDATGVCFDKNTKLCTETDTGVKPLRENWFNVNTNITALCVKDCPNMFEIAQCKNITDTQGLKRASYETFCSTFNDSLKCVKEHLGTCKLGTRFYADLLERNIMQYWQYICNSGCRNIDETVTIVANCADHLGTYTSKESLCLGHNQFKTCVTEATDVCDEVMKIVRFKYTKYDIVDKACMTTTSTTTPSTTTTTTTTTTTPPPTTTIEATTPTMDTATPSLEDCLDQIDTSQLDVEGDVNIEHIVLMLQIESCIHNFSDVSLYNGLVLQQLDYYLGYDNIAIFYRKVKQQGWTVLRDHVTQCKNNPDGSRGCSGHRYGMLQCNSAHDISMSIVILLLITAVLTLMRPE